DVLRLEPAAALRPGDAGHAGRPDIELHVELDRERARVAGEAAVSEEEQAVAGHEPARVGRHHRAAGSPARGLRGLVAAHVLAHVEDGLGKPGACGHGGHHLPGGLIDAIVVDQVGPVSGHEAAGPRYRLEVIGAAGGVARDQAVGVELGHHHARDALVDLAVVGRRRAAWIGRVVDAAVAVVVDAVAALRTVGAGRPRDPAVIA